MNRFLTALLLGLLALTGAARAQGDPFAPILAAGTNFNRLAEAVEALPASGHPQALAVVEALSDQRLFARRDPSGLLFRDEAGVLRIADTGEAATDVDPSTLAQIRMNNRVRRAVDVARGTLSLLHPDRGVRLRAAQSVFSARDPSLIPVLDRAVEAERDAGVKRAMVSARAAAILASDQPIEAKQAAIAVLVERGDLDARGLLSGIGAPAEIATAAAAGVVAIDRNLFAWQMAQDVWFGLSLGSVLLLAAIGLAVTFGVMGVINMAHGEMVMLGAYTTFAVQEVFRGWLPGLFDFTLFVAIPLAFLVSAAFGVLIERTVIRFLYGRPLETLLATWGISLVLQQLVRSFFGANNREVGNPSWMSGATEWGRLAVTWNRLWIIVFAMLVFAALMILLRRTRFGLEMRAVTQNRRMAAAMGIRTPRVDAMTFALGSGVAGLAGVAISQIDNVSPNLGQGYIIDSFMVVVFGGVGNLWGTLVASLLLGVTNKVLEPLVGAVLGKILVLVLLIMFIQRKPRGLFPLRGRAVEQ